MGYSYKKIRLSKDKVIDEHRHIMQQFLGRKLKRNEVVHHINGDKRDNRIENLEVQKLKIHSRNFMTGRPVWNKNKEYNNWKFKNGKYWCNKCKKYLDKTKFFKSKNKKYGISDYCKKCQKIFQQKYSHERKKGVQNPSCLIKKYKVTLTSSANGYLLGC